MKEEKKRRVGKACDICRIKKIKCNGKKPCDKCLTDNRVCTFSDRRRDREKHYPPGYIELMETRNELLTKSLLRLVSLSVKGEDMQSYFIQKHQVLEKYEVEKSEMAATQAAIATATDGIIAVDKSGVATKISINKVLDVLVKEEKLLEGEPVEWEEGTVIASKLSNSNVDTATKAFAVHTSQRRAESPEHGELESEPLRKSNTVSTVFSNTDNSTFNSVSPASSQSDELQLGYGDQNQFSLKQKQPLFFDESEAFSPERSMFINTKFNSMNSPMSSPVSMSPTVTYQPSELAELPYQHIRQSSLSDSPLDHKHARKSSLDGHIVKPSYHGHHNHHHPPSKLSMIAKNDDFSNDENLMLNSYLPEAVDSPLVGPNFFNDEDSFKRLSEDFTLNAISDELLNINSF